MELGRPSGRPSFFIESKPPVLLILVQSIEPLDLHNVALCFTVGRNSSMPGYRIGTRVISRNGQVEVAVEAAK